MRKTVFAEGEFYHIYNRGVDKRTIFSGQKEYQRFLVYVLLLNTKDTTRITDRMPKLLEAKPRELRDMRDALGEPLVAIGAFCLMPNHFHLLVTPLTEGGVSQFMQRVQTAYTMYFNRAHKRTGALFQGTFKSEHLSDENHAA